MQRFALTETQANAILDMRLRSLRRLEEVALRTERENLKDLTDQDQGPHIFTGPSGLRKGPYRPGSGSSEFYM